MNRRQVLKNLGLIGLSIPILNACDFSEPPKAIPLTNIPLQFDQQDQLHQLAGLIIPDQEGIPGAKTMELHLFALEMMDVMTKAEDLEKLNLGLIQFGHFFLEQFTESFAKRTPVQTEQFLSQLEKNKTVFSPRKDKEGKEIVEENQINELYMRFKGHLIEGYRRSQYVQLDVFGYRLVPGKFVGEVQINDQTDLKTLLA